MSHRAIAQHILMNAIVLNLQVAHFPSVIKEYTGTHIAEYNTHVVNADADALQCSPARARSQYFEVNYYKRNEMHSTVKK